MITSSLCYNKIEEARETLFQPNRPFKKQILNLVVFRGLELEKENKQILLSPLHTTAESRLYTGRPSLASSETMYSAQSLYLEVVLKVTCKIFIIILFCFFMLFFSRKNWAVKQEFKIVSWVLLLFLILIYMVEVLFECASDFSVVGKREGCSHPVACALQSAGERVIRKAKMCVSVATERNVACSSKNIKYLILSWLKVSWKVWKQE